ncbi:MAG: hypothetical protein GY820_39920 [Gammaproteobacteria bacterium]|nr:hypothetical protein [Gammaproteobacteria bacterium]
MRTDDLPLFAAITTDPKRAAFDEYRHTPHGGEVANKFLRLSIGIKRRGHRHYGGRDIIGRLRWHYKMRHGPDDGDYKINNNWQVQLEEWAESRAPELKGFFTRRRQRQKD